MNGNMNLGKRVAALEKDGGADIKKEISDLQAAVTEIQTSVTTAQEEISNLENKVNSLNVYSTDEQIVATWIDGKPIYQKTIIINNPTIATDVPYAHGISNFKHLIYSNIGYSSSEGIEYAEPIHVANDFSRNSYVDSTNIYITAKGKTYTQLRVTLQYTKTTD